MFTSSQYSPTDGLLSRIQQKELKTKEWKKKKRKKKEEKKEKNSKVDEHNLFFRALLYNPDWVGADLGRSLNLATHEGLPSQVKFKLLIYLYYFHEC